MRPWSLRRRLLKWLILSTVAIGLIALADTWREAVRTAQGVSDRVLAGSALAIAERVSVDEEGGIEVDIPYSSLEMLTSTAQDRVFYRVEGPLGAFLTGYEDLPPVPVEAGGVGFADGRYNGLDIRSATLLREISTGSASIAFTVTVAESTLARRALARAMLVRSAVRLVALIAGAAAIVWVAVTLALRPLDQLGRAIAERSPDDLRPVTAATPQEVGLLVGAINSFMQRLDGALGALRNFTGNAGHQLRTPLSVVRTQLALAARSPNPGLAAEAIESADRALERAERVLAQLLALARVDAAAGAPVSETIDVVVAAKAVTAELVPAALLRNVDLGFEGPDRAFAVAEPVLLAELLRNLVGNAVTYAGEAAVVTVRIVQEPDAVVLQVVDNGQGMPAVERARAMEHRRGRRKSAPAGTEIGHGLGLGIAAEIAELFRSHLQLDEGQGGKGLVASIRLGRARPPVPK